MATKKPKKSESKEPAVTVPEDDAFLKLMRKRLDASVTNEKDERSKGIADIKFIFATDQWDADVKSQRGKGRLCLTINKLPAFLDQIDGDIRLHKPGIKVKAVDSSSDPATADVIEGLVRYIERRSGAAKIYSYAGLHLAAGGRGAWRVKTEYADENSFLQDILIDRIINAYAVYYDSSATRDDKQDGKYFFIVSDMSKDEYREEYNQEPIDFEVDGAEFTNWIKGETVRVAEYFYKDNIGDKTIYLLADGRTVEEKDLVDGDVVKNERVAPQYRIKWAKVDGKRILDKGEIPGKMFPIVLVWGKQACIDGKIEARGFARFAKDSAKLYNYYRSNDAESAALQPKQPFLMPDVCLGAHKEVWDKSLDENYPYLPFHVDPAYPALAPTRQPPAMGSSANMDQIQIANSELNDTTGLTKAGLGQNDGEKSGKMVNLRKIESDTGQFAFMDNLSEGAKTTGQIIVGMIPEVFDTAERQQRILGKDMKEKIVTLNDGKGIDVTVGRYDVDIDVEASYSTQREEFLDKMDSLLARIPPEQVAMISDILVGTMDFSRADDIAARIKRMIPPEILGPEDNEDGKQKEPEPQKPPDPLFIATLEEKKMDIKILEETLKGMKIDNELKYKAKKEDIAGILAELMNEKPKGDKANAGT